MSSVYLVLVQLTVFVLLLSLLLECHNDETYEYVHHEEGDDDDVDDEEYRDDHTVVVDWANILCMGVDGSVEEPVGEQRAYCQCFETLLLKLFINL